MKNFAKYFFCFNFISLHTKNIEAENIWILDKELSEIKFELPVLLAKNVNGQFTKFDGSIVIDLKNKENNRALFFVNINSMELNYKKQRKLLLSDIFFDEINFPIAVIDTKKFNIPEDSNSLLINSELQIKNFVNVIPLKINIVHLANGWMQIKANLKFSRKRFELGKNAWSSTVIIKDKILLKANLFFYKKK